VTMPSVAPLGWVLLGVLVFAMLAVELGGSRQSAVGFRASAARSAVWILIGLGFGFAPYFLNGAEAAFTYWAAYLVEESLSVDNLFVFVLVFSYFDIPLRYQRRVLFWGILGAVVMRGIFIALGMALMARFHWVIYPFAGLLFLSAVRLLREKEAKTAAACCKIGPRWISRVFPVTPRLYNGRFLVRENGVLLATPLLAALLAIEASDLIFAIDSIPAVLAITRDPFVVYSSNIFALLGMRSLYFLLAGALDRLRYLRYGLALILAFVAVRMVLADLQPIPVPVSLGVIGAVLLATVLASLLASRKDCGQLSTLSRKKA
jgi:tellurite resistance protein TerC